MPITKASSSAVAPGAKGDLVVGNATNDSGILAVGSANQVLTVDSSTATGLKWATPAGGSLTLLSTTNLSGASTTVSSISGSYNQLFIEVQNAQWNTADDSCAFSTNLTGAISLFKSATTNAYSTTTLQTSITGLDDTTQNQKRTGGNNYFSFLFTNYASTTAYKGIRILGIYEGASSGGRLIQFNGGAASNTAINSFTFQTGNGYTLTAGTIKVYGVN